MVASSDSSFHNQRLALDKIRNSIGTLAIVDALTGYGKTVFLRELQRIYSPPDWVLAYVSLKDAKRSIDVIRRTIQALRPEDQEITQREDQTITSLVFSLPSHRSLAIFFDDVQLVAPETFDWIQREFVPTLKDELEQRYFGNFLLVFSGQNIRSIGSNSLIKWGPHSHIPLTPFDRKAIQDYVDSTHNEQIRNALRNARYKRWLVEKIIHLCGGHPRASVRLIKALEKGEWLPYWKPRSEKDDRIIFERHIAEELDQLMNGIEDKDKRLLEGLSIFRYINSSTIKVIQKEFEIDTDQPPLPVISKLRRQNLLIQDNILDPVVRNGLLTKMILTNQNQYNHLNHVAQDAYETWLTNFNDDKLEEAQKYVRGSIYHCLCQNSSESETIQCLRRNISVFELLLTKQNYQDVNRETIEEELSILADEDIRIMLDNRGFSVPNLLDSVFQIDGDNSSECSPTSAPIFVTPPDIRSFTFAILNDKGQVIGTGYWVIFREKFYIITCAHVVVQLQQRNTIKLRSFELQVGELYAEVVWFNPPNDGRSWNADNDIAVLEPISELQSNLQPLELDGDEYSLESYRNQPELLSFGYPLTAGTMGESFISLMCDEKVASGFVRIHNNGKPIDYGVSGAPLYHVGKNKIVGMIHAKSGNTDAKSGNTDSQRAYFIPSCNVLNVLSQLNSAVT